MEKMITFTFRLSFALWILANILLCLVPGQVCRCLLALGTILSLAALVYALATPGLVSIPFPALSTNQDTVYLQLHFDVYFWLILAIGKFGQ